MRCLKTLRMSHPQPLHEWLVEQAEISVADLNEEVGKKDFEGGA